VAPLLLESPLYAASQLNGPALLKVCEAELGITPPVTVTGEPTTVPVPPQVEPEKKLYVTVPPAWNELVSVAESATDPPTVIGLIRREVAMVGLALLTANGSQALVAPPLLASPL
jgi:hypothetical protein